MSKLTGAASRIGIGYTCGKDGVRIENAFYEAVTKNEATCVELRDLCIEVTKNEAAADQGRAIRRLESILLRRMADEIDPEADVYDAIGDVTFTFTF